MKLLRDVLLFTTGIYLGAAGLNLLVETVATWPWPTIGATVALLLLLTAWWAIATAEEMP